MVLDILNRILLVLFFLSCFTVIRHGYYFIQAFFSSTDEEIVKYKISKRALILLGISISYILTAIFTGIKL
jgi:hypothetical protein